MSNLPSVKEIVRLHGLDILALEEAQADKSRYDARLNSATQALKAQFIELTDRVIGEDYTEENIRLANQFEKARRYAVNNAHAEARERRDQLVKEYFDE